MERKAPLISLCAGAGLAVLICLISLSLYDKIYFFDGYAITKFLWVIAFGCMICGVIGLLTKSDAWAIGLIVVLVIALFSTCDYSSGSSSSSDECAVCQGSGLVNDGFIDFKTCPVCKGSGVDFH